MKSAKFLIFGPRRSRSTAAYSDQTFPWTICWSVGPYVRPYVGLSNALWKNGGSDLCSSRRILQIDQELTKL